MNESLRIKGVQPPVLDVGKPISVSVIFYLCCKRLHVRVGKQALLDAANSTAREFIQIQKVVEENCSLELWEEIEREGKGVKKAGKQADKEGGENPDQMLRENMAALVLGDGIHSMVTPSRAILLQLSPINLFNYSAPFKVRWEDHRERTRVQEEATI